MQEKQFNWDPSKVELILGPPGTGKTTTLMSRIDECLQVYSPNRICFVAFTRRAAIEAVTRASDQFGLSHEQLLHFRTLHSFAFKHMGFSSKQVMGVGDYINIARSLGLNISYRGLREDGSFHGQTKGDRLLFLANLSRIQLKSIEQVHEEWHDENLSVYEIQQMYETIESYKFENGKKDFTDVINNYIEFGFVPELDVLFVDEAQDLAPIQWQMVRKLAENVKQVFIAGDDDQAIFRWAGAEVSEFINLPVGRTIILDQSYRVPSKIATCANKIIQNITTRLPKAWKPRLEMGSAKFISDPESLDMGTGSWLLLARNTYMLDAYQQICMRRGYVFESSVESPIDPSLLDAIRMWERLRKGKTLTVSQSLLVYDWMGSKVGVAYGMKTRLKEENPERLVTIHDLKREFGLIADGIWHEAFDRIPIEQREYLLAALKRGEKVDGEARIRINTIHGVKGGQADNVVIFMDIAARTYREFQMNPDDEHRVWYVGLTRAIQNLYIIYPKTPNHYPLDMIVRGHKLSL